MPNLSKIYLAIMGLFLVAACNHKQAKNITGIEGTSWVLEHMSGAIPSGVDIDLQFEKDKINGKGVCNRYFSNYELNGQQIMIQAVGATKMMCHEHNNVEAKYFEALQNAQEFSIQNDQLTIKTKGGNLIFKPTNKTSSMGAAKSSPNFSGQYYSGSLDQYWQSLTIYPDKKGYQVIFSASIVGDEPACYFQGKAYVEDSKLVVPLPEKESKPQMVIIKKEKTVEVFTEAEENRLILLYYCSGGASLAGTYTERPTIVFI